MGISAAALFIGTFNGQQQLILLHLPILSSSAGSCLISGHGTSFLVPLRCIQAVLRSTIRAAMLPNKVPTSNPRAIVGLFEVQQDLLISRSRLVPRVQFGVLFLSNCL